MTVCVLGISGIQDGQAEFGSKLISWIKVYIFSSSMSVLVTQSPIEEFSIGRGLKQGDPLALFLFLIVSEGLIGLVRLIIQKEIYVEFKVNDILKFDILQYADHTILLGESWENLWCMKTILKSFEMVSELKVNFYKSKFYGINLEECFFGCCLIIYLLLF